MGMIKRIFKQTSNRLLSKLGVQHSSAQRLVVNQTVPCGPLASIQAKKMRARRTNKRSRAGRVSSQDAAMLSALNANLPQVQFHHVHGPNAELSSSKMVARRTQSFCHALVFSNRVISPNERVYIKVLEISKGWSGTIRFGFTAVDPATLQCQVPKHACPDMTNAGNTWARALADEVVRRNSVIHFSYNSDGFIHYGINNQDCGIFYANVNTSQNLWFIVDIYGLTAAVELIDPRMCATGAESDSLSAAEENYTTDLGTAPQRTTLAKLESHQRLRKKRARKMAHPGSVQALGQWPAPGSWTVNSQARSLQRDTLPNLSSMELPQTQQNIYSPMPNSFQVRPPQTTTAHDYYQILNTSGQALPAAQMAQSSARERANKDLNESTATTSSSTRVEDELSQQMENMRVRVREEPVYVRPFRFVTQSIPDIDAYVAALERTRVPIHLDEPRNFKPLARGEVYTPGRVVLAPAPSTNTPDRVTLISKPMSSNTRPKSSRTRNSSSGAATGTAKNSNTSSTTTTNNKGRDNNNQPPGRDCPICFERPINCVLYQCGHMCTCYECGVKQWKTQSRTCPICRTVIKDVIKTYMS